MTVKELRQALENQPDDMEVYFEESGTCYIEIAGAEPHSTQNRFILLDSYGVL